MTTKVVISGTGVISSLGLGSDKFWDNIINGKSIVEPIPKKWHDYSDYKSGIWSPLPQIDFIKLGFNRIETMQLDPVSMIAIAATKQALAQAKIRANLVNARKNQYELSAIDPKKTGIFIGTGIGGAKTFLENFSFQALNKLAASDDKEIYEKYKLSSPKNLNPFVVSMLMPNAVSASVGIKYSLNSVNRTISQACSSGTSAIGTAFEKIKSGEIDYAICGGSEYLYDEYGAIYRGFDVAKTLAIPENDIHKANRPFDKNRSGFLYSQGGAAIVILENAKTAKARNVNPLAEIVSFSESFDAFSMMIPKPESPQIKNMIHNALNKANINYGQVGYINTHGTGTLTNDENEANILLDIFGDKPLVNSSKSLLGHTIGASGAFETIITALSLKNQFIHKNLNLQNPISDLNFAFKNKKKLELEFALTQSFAFGGHNSCIVLKKAT